MLNSYAEACGWYVDGKKITCPRCTYNHSKYIPSNGTHKVVSIHSLHDK